MERLEESFEYDEEFFPGLSSTADIIQVSDQVLVLVRQDVMQKVPAILGTRDPSLREAGVRTHPVLWMVDAEVWNKIRGEFETVESVGDVDAECKSRFRKCRDFAGDETDVIRCRCTVCGGLINPFAAISYQPDFGGVEVDIFP